MAVPFGFWYLKTRRSKLLNDHISVREVLKPVAKLMNTQSLDAFLRAVQGVADDTWDVERQLLGGLYICWRIYEASHHVPH